MIVKLEREAEMALLPEILKHRINLLRMDERFIFDEGREVRISLLGNMIFDDRQRNETDFSEAVKRVIEKGKFPERAKFNYDELARALTIAEAMWEDRKQGIELDNPSAYDLRNSVCMNLGCPSTLYACKSYAVPRSKYIEKYATRVEVGTVEEIAV